MAKIYLDSIGYKKSVIDPLVVGSTKLESAGRECSLLYIPSSFRYYSYLSNLKGLITSYNKRCNDILAWTNDSVSKWEITKNDLLVLSRKLEVKSIAKRNQLVR